MFKVNLSFVPPGGGETDYSLTITVPALPREGDYIRVLRDYKTPPTSENMGSENFIVRRVWWSVSFPDDGQHVHRAGSEPVGTSEIWVECEYAISPTSSEAHKRAAQAQAKYPAKEFEESMY